MPLPRPVRLSVSVVSMCALAVPLAACGAKDASSGAASRDAAPAASGVQVDSSTDPVAAFIDRVRTGLGQSGTAHVVIHATGPMAGSGAGDVSYGPDGPQLQMTATLPMLGHGKATVILVGHKAYVSVPPFTPTGKFLMIDKGALPSTPGMSGVTPEKVFAAVRAAVVGVDDLGSATVAGTPTTHYRLHLDPAKAAHALGAPAHGMATAPGKVLMDVWLDGSDRIRQVSTDVQGTKVDVQLSQWGRPVHIQAPPAADVVKAPAGMMSGMSGMLGGSAPS